MSDDCPMSNDILKQVFQEQHEVIVDNVNTTAIMDRLFSAKVIGISDMHDLDLIPHRIAKCRRLLIWLHKSKNPEAFVQLYLAVRNEPANKWLIDHIDRLYAAASETASPASAAAASSLQQPNVKSATRQTDSMTREILLEEIENVERENTQLKEKVKSLEEEIRSLRRIIARLNRDREISIKNNNVSLDENPWILRQSHNSVHSNQLHQESVDQVSSFTPDADNQFGSSAITNQTQPFFDSRGELPPIDEEKYTAHFLWQETQRHQSTLKLEKSPIFRTARHCFIGELKRAEHGERDAIQIQNEPWSDEDDLIQHELFAEATRPTDAVEWDVTDNCARDLVRQTDCVFTSFNSPPVWDLFDASDDDTSGISKTGKTPLTGNRAVTSEAATLLSKVVAKGNSVRGVTLLGNKLFVVRCPSLQQIEVYDSATFVLLRPLLVPGFVGVPHGVTSCSTNNCLYVSDYSSLSCSGAVFRIELRGDANVVKNWRVNGCPNGLSVNGNGHVIVAVRSAGDVDRIMEISTHGSLIREIRLQPEVTKIWHAVQLTGDLFVVSHGERGDRSLGDVCIVQVRMGANELKPADGLVKLRFRKNPGVATTAISEPTQVAIDQNGCVFVADRDNNRILTLDRSLIGASVVPVTIDGGLQGPCALFLDESRERLYVGEWNGGRVLVFDDIFSGCR